MIGEGVRTVNTHLLKYIPILGLIIFAIVISGCTSPNVATPALTATPAPTILPTPTPSSIPVTTPAATSAPAPKAYFTYISGNATEPLAVSFLDESLNSPTSWSWSFGDGVVSSEKDPLHIYASPGNYTVSLAVTNANGRDTVSEELMVAVSATPTPVAGYIPLPRQTVTLNNITITNVIYMINYSNSGDSYFGSSVQGASSLPDLPDGITMFNCSLTLTNMGSADHTINSINIETPGFLLLAVSPTLPTYNVTPGSDLRLTMTIGSQMSHYYGPLTIQLNPA